MAKIIHPRPRLGGRGGVGGIMTGGGVNVGGGGGAAAGIGVATGGGVPAGGIDSSIMSANYRRAGQGARNKHRPETLAVFAS